MAFDFPSSPVLNEVWTDAATGKQYIWNGFAWGKSYSEPPAGVAHPPAETIPVEPPIDGATSVDAVLRQLSVDLAAVENDNGQKVAKAGNTEGIMTGFLTLHADPVDPLHAVPKQYVDGRASLPTGGTVGQVLAINPSGVAQWGAAADGGNF